MTTPPEPDTSNAVAVELIAVLVAAANGAPLVMTIQEGAALPSGPFEHGHRSLQRGLRAWVEGQTGRAPGFLEQLYTFADRDRTGSETSMRAISISYLGLTREEQAAQSPSAGWRSWYDYFPWEDHRDGAPTLIADLIIPKLRNWSESEAIAALRESEEELERRVRQKTSELARKNDALRIEIEERRRTEERLRLSEERMRALAHHDPLTGAANRNLYRELLGAALERARRANHHVAVVLVDLDQFKSINDNFGHDAGDAMLVGVAKRLQESVRTSDVVARIGGDEFVLMIDNLHSRADVDPILAKLSTQFAKPIQHGAEAFHVDASFGCALFPLDASDAESLLKRADSDMYSQKRKRRPVLRAVGA